MSNGEMTEIEQWKVLNSMNRDIGEIKEGIKTVSRDIKDMKEANDKQREKCQKRMESLEDDVHILKTKMGMNGLGNKIKTNAPEMLITVATSVAIIIAYLISHGVLG